MMVEEQDKPFAPIRQFENLFSGIDSWDIQLIDAADNAVLAQSAGATEEISKLQLYYCGPKTYPRLGLGNKVFDLEEVNLLAKKHQILVLVNQLNADDYDLEVELTVAQQILQDKKYKVLSKPISQVLAYILMNHQLFKIDPSSLVNGCVAQYDEYDYLAANILFGVSHEIHPELVVTKVFEKAGLSNYKNFAVIGSINSVLSKLKNYDFLDQKLFNTSPKELVYTALLFDFINGYLIIDSQEAQQLSLDLAHNLANTSSAEKSLGLLGDKLKDIDESEQTDLLIELNNCLESAEVLLKTSTTKEIFERYRAGKDVLDIYGYSISIRSKL